MSNAEAKELTLEAQAVVTKDTVSATSESTDNAGITAWLENVNYDICNQEKELCEQITALGYTDIRTLEEITRLEIDLDQNNVETLLSLKHNTKELLDRKNYYASIVPIEPSKLHISIDAAEKIIAQHPELNIFKRRGILVRVIQHESQDPSNPQARISIIDIKTANLVRILTQYGTFMKYDKRTKKAEKVDCPRNIAESLIAQQEWKFLRELQSIITTPTLRIDGSILDIPGYDDMSGLLFISDGCPVPKIPEYPTPQELDRAEELFLECFSEFPFEGAKSGGASKSVMAAAVLTSLTRHMYPTAPIIAISAPTPASGKTLSADLIALIGTGKSNNVLAPAENETEEKKRIFALLREQAPFICIDNISKPFGSATFCAITTQDTYKDRILGCSESAAVSTKTVILFTGNNLTFVGDLASRVILCKINANLERPGKRTFKIKDIRRHVRNNRGNIIWGALTLLRGYFAAGKPPQNVDTFARFEQWSDTIRSTLLGRGMADPCANYSEIEAVDPVQSSLGNLFFALYEQFGETPFKVNEIMPFLQSKSENKISNAVYDLCGTSVNAHKLGAQLRSYKDRIECGIQLVNVGLNQGYTLWKVTRIDKIKQ